jgi:hypothetical protein
MRPAWAGLAMLVLVACQAPAASDVAVPTPAAPVVAAAASVAVWGEVPRACT